MIKATDLDTATGIALIERGIAYLRRRQSEPLPWDEFWSFSDDRMELIEQLVEALSIDPQQVKDEL